MKIYKKFTSYAVALVIGAVAVAVGSTTAYGGTVSTAAASAYGVQLNGPMPIEATPLVSASLATNHADDSILEVPADPLATSFTAAVNADTAKQSTLTATLQAVMDPASSGLPTKWNARGHAITEDLGAVTDTILADVIESESVAACEGNKTVYGSAARIVNLTVAGTSVVLPAPTPNQVVFDQAGIRIVFWETNWNSATGGTTDGESVFTNGIHATAPGGVDLIVSHSEATAACAAKAQPAAGNTNQCEDGVDNKDPEDSLADRQDPGCHTDGDAGNTGSYDPNDNNETDLAACVDGTDNDDSEDALADEADPGCHTDSDASNPASYAPQDTSENNGLENAPPATAVITNPAFAG